MSEAKRPFRSPSHPITPVVDEKPMIALPRVSQALDEDTDPGIPSPEEGEVKDAAQVFLGMPAQGGDPLVVGGMFSDAVSELEHALGPSGRTPKKSGGTGMRLQVVAGPKVEDSRAEGRMHIHKREDLVDSLVEMPAAIERTGYSADPRFQGPNSRSALPKQPRRMELPAVDDYRANRIRDHVRTPEATEEMPPPPPVPWREAGGQNVAKVQRDFGRVNAETFPEQQGRSLTTPQVEIDTLSGQRDGPPVPRAAPVPEPPPPADNGLSFSAVFLVTLIGLGVGAGIFYYQPQLLGVVPVSSVPPVEARIDPSTFHADTEPPKTPTVRNPAIHTGVLQLWAKQTCKVWVDGKYVGVVEGHGADAGPRGGLSNLPPIELSPGLHKLRATSRSGSYNATIRIDEGRPSDVVIDVGR